MADRAQPRPDAHPAPLHRRACRRSRRKYRQLNRLGAFQLGGFLTYGTIESADPDATDTDERGIRAYFEGNGKFQLDPLWSITGSLRVATDKTVTRRYDITRDDRLRNFVNAERISPDCYICIAGWAFEGLRADDDQKQIPIALPAIDARFRLDDPVLGGKFELQANSLAIIRIEGQDTQRAFASARWDLRRLTPWGQELTLTAYRARRCLSHRRCRRARPSPIYRGTDGWHTRGIGALAADLQWPFVGTAVRRDAARSSRGCSWCSPRRPRTSTSPTRTRARSTSRTATCSRSTASPATTAGRTGRASPMALDWSLDRPEPVDHSTIGQSYRIRTAPAIFPEGTGLTDRLSDIVGRTRIRYGRLIDITDRFRLDKDNFAVRRNELDLTVGSEQTYAQIGYLRLNRDIDPAIEDLRDKEELRLAGRVKFHRYWSIFGATVIDLTDKSEDPLSLADGFAAGSPPPGHRLRGRLYAAWPVVAPRL